MSGRSVPLWSSDNPNAKVPARVRLRIFLREKGRCHLSGRTIRPGDAWDLDHKIALCNGGAHSEDNLYPAIREKHREKTARDVREKAKVARLQSKHLGIKSTSGRKLQSRGFDKTRTRKFSGEVVPR